MITVEELPKEPTQEPTTEANKSVEHLAIARRFNIETPSREEENKLIEVWELAKSLSKTGEIQDVMWQVIHLEGTLGAPRLGEGRLDRLYRYAKLKRQEKAIQEELKSVGGSGNLY
jgi:hypothetical protein